MRIPIRSTATLLLAVAVTSCGDSVQPVVVAKLAIRSAPSAGIVNTALAPVLVELQDAGGKLTHATDPVTIALGANPNAATLGGPLTRTAVDGVATFDSLTIDKIGAYTLTVSSASIPGASAVVPITPLGRRLRNLVRSEYGRFPGEAAETTRPQRPGGLGAGVGVHVA